MKIDPNEWTPNYITKKGKLLWIDSSKYDEYSRAANCKILIGADGKFWGYGDSEKIKRFENIKEKEVD